MLEPDGSDVINNGLSRDTSRHDRRITKSLQLARWRGDEATVVQVGHLYIKWVKTVCLMLNIY